jgi:hypothetical protein
MVTSLGFVAWGYLADERVAVAANLLFVLISLRHILRIAAQRRPVDLTNEQNRVCSSLFRSMTPREFLNLSELAEPGSAEAGTLIRKGDVVDAVIIELESDELVLPAPMMLGEVSYALGESSTASATVRLESPAQTRRWTMAMLRDLEVSHPDLAVPFLASLGANLAKKVKG